MKRFLVFLLVFLSIGSEAALIDTVLLCDVKGTDSSGNLNEQVTVKITESKIFNGSETILAWLYISVSGERAHAFVEKKNPGKQDEEWEIEMSRGKGDMIITSSVKVNRLTGQIIGSSDFRTAHTSFSGLCKKATGKKF